MIDLASRPLPRKALSLRQPWCEAILELGKDIENRAGTRVTAATSSSTPPRT
jgi:hypothetical protein